MTHITDADEKAAALQDKAGDSGGFKAQDDQGHPAPDRAASRSSILNVAFFGAMTQLRGTPLTQRHLFWLEEFLFSSEALNFRVPLS